MIEAEGEPAVSQQGSFFRGLGDEGSSCLGPLLYKTGHSKHKGPDFPVPPYYMYVYIYIYIYIYIFINIYIYIYMYIYCTATRRKGEVDRDNSLR